MVRLRRRTSAEFIPLHGSIGTAFSAYFRTSCLPVLMRTEVRAPIMRIAVARPSGVKPAGGGLQMAVGDRGGLSKTSLCECAKRHDLPGLIRQIQRISKNTRQAIVTTHSESLLSDPSIGSEAVVRFKPSQEGTEVALPSEQEQIMLPKPLRRL